MRQRTARYDKRVEILKRANVRNEKTGADKAVWVRLAVVFAQVDDVLPGKADRYADVVDIGNRPCKVRIRYRADLDGELRLKIRGREYRVVSGPAEVNRRDELEMLAEHYTGEGDRP